MAVLVTGGAGYIGSHMVWALLDAGESVVVLDRLSTGFAWAVAPEATLVVGDVGDGPLVSSLIELHEVDAIVHFAGSIVVPDSVVDPLGYYHNNTCKTRSLIEAASRGGVRHFIFSSTAAVYGAAGMDPSGRPHRWRPTSPYGTSKLMSELMLRDAAVAHGFTFTALRYFNVAGADPQGRTGQSSAGATHLIKVACETVLGKRVGMRCSATTIRRPTAPACATTSTSATLRTSIAWRSSGCARGAATSWRIVATATAIRCWRCWRPYAVHAGATSPWRSVIAVPETPPPSSPTPPLPDRCLAGSRNWTTWTGSWPMRSHGRPALSPGACPAPRSRELD